MTLFNQMNRIFNPNFENFEPEYDADDLKECKWCEAYHKEDSEFCCEKCEKEYYLETQGEDTETEGCDRYHADKDEELSNN